ncbi:protein FAR1-RELATED SEQUENCE 5-like [Henckelia pumila]|uniref:protein FAR1-RELATED SEQUENCE 5-like n=1 Tax=Henckelia pumila TaxID=405737 RepID=UPI003C6E3522
MAKALLEKWPETYHRLCIWHIYQNAATHLSSVFSKFKEFSKDFSSCIYKFEEERDFLTTWQEMLNKYDLQTNPWLERMFKIKEKWALVYGRQTFCADMTTTQRSESMNGALKKYVNYKNDLLQFFQHFRRLVDDRRYEELKADFRTNHSTPVLSFPVKILKHAVSVYTHETFQLFQNELCKAHDSKLEVVTESEVISHYKISSFNKQYQHTVTYDFSDDKISCSCKKLEFAGLLCSHVLKVFTYKNVVRIPEIYIKKRWTKMAKKWIVGISSPPNDKIEESLDVIKEEGENVKIGIRYKELCRLHHQLVTRAALTEETYELTRSVIIKAIEEVDMSLENRGTPKQTPSLKVSSEKQILESGCNEVVVKGFKIKPNSRAKSGKRPKSALERAKKKRKSNSNKDKASFINDTNINIEQIKLLW